MNSSTSEALWPSPVAARSIASSIANTQSALIAAVTADIIDAIDSGAYTSSTDITSETSADVQYVSLLLNQGGYTVVHTDTDLILSW